MTVTFLSGSGFEALQEAVFERVSTVAGNQPEAVVFLEANDYRHPAIADAWAAAKDPLRIRVTDFDDLACEYYERLVGPGTRLDTTLRRQLIGQALREVGDEAHFAEAQAYNRDIRELLAELAGEGYDDTAEIWSLVNDHLRNRAANVVGRTAESFATLRTACASETYSISDTYQTVLSSQTELENTVKADVVVVSNYSSLSQNEIALLQRLAETTEIFISLPLTATPESGDSPPESLIGANEYTADTVEIYRSLADECVHVPAESKEDSYGSKLAVAAGQIFTRTPTAEEDETPPSGLHWHSTPTPIREARQVARRVRQQLADGADPEDVLVVVPELLSYRSQLAEAFDEVGVHAANVGRPPIQQTQVGRAVLRLVDCCLSEPTQRDVAALASSPAVTLGDDDETVDTATILNLTDRLPTTDLDRLQSELDDDSTTAIDHFCQDVETVASASQEKTINALRELFDAVELESNAERLADGGAGIELTARETVERTLDAVETVESAAGECGFGYRKSADPAQCVADSLDGQRVPQRTRSQKGVVRVVGPQDALGLSYDHLHLVGLTRAAFPPNRTRPEFFERVFDALPGVDTVDRSARARYQFAVLVGAAETVHITTPETGVNGDEHLPSPVLTEFSRVTGLKAKMVDRSVASAADLQRELAGLNDRERETALSQAIDERMILLRTAETVRQGVECVKNRAKTELTSHDAQLEPETVAALHETKALSPTQLRDYARCGFRYYAERVLGFEEPEEFPLEPTPLDRGSLVHDSLESFYEDLLSDTNGPVNLADYERADLEERLLKSVRMELDAIDAPTDGAFGDRWLEQLLAGLATPSENAHYGGDYPHKGQDRGLFVRFLEHELDADDAVLVVEEPLDFGAGDGEIRVTVPDGREITVHGRIDRVTVKDNDGVVGIVHDYKTSDPTTKLTFDGVGFQLPVYTIAAQQELKKQYGEDLRYIDGEFYTVEPPTDVTRKRSLQKTIWRKDGDRDDLERFLDSVVPERISDISDSIGNGGFHTTTLEADEAKCKHCQFRDVCDVRHHRRRERVAAVDEEEYYVPQRARPGSFYDGLGGDEA
ncbi:PD-(D/E)XK nuclease family protein (plasmid) [Haladaptatus sp. SPP-AMP-3]|uniref:PD-(D/E)XK nuclease family protein n=1 Tax=Haladaptatus sp. SPP-AMP-3 TaxID=3121295 RepID=UPI003C2D6F7B